MSSTAFKLPNLDFPFQAVSYKPKITNCRMPTVRRSAAKHKLAARPNFKKFKPTNQPSFTFLLQSRLRDLTGQR